MTIYSLDGRHPDLHPDTWVAPGAHLIGAVYLDEGASVWFGSVLRGDNEPLRIGRGTNLQEHCICHTDMGYPLSVGEFCTIGHRATLHGCIIGAESLVGMGAVVLNGARIGRNCLIGAGALVTEGTEIPDGHLALGSPARVVRRLTPEQITGLRETAERYVQNMHRFRNGLHAQP